MKKPTPKKFVKLHNDGTVWAKGQTVDGVPTGYWEWFRKDGVRMRSGYFENGEQTVLKRHESAYFDSGVGHIYLARGRGPATVVVAMTPA